MDIVHFPESSLFASQDPPKYLCDSRANYTSQLSDLERRNRFAYGKIYENRVRSKRRHCDPRFVLHLKRHCDPCFIQVIVDFYLKVNSCWDPPGKGILTKEEDLGKVLCAGLGEVPGLVHCPRHLEGGQNGLEIWLPMVDDSENPSESYKRQEDCSGVHCYLLWSSRYDASYIQESNVKIYTTYV
jgi:hypothetical protein